MTFGTWSMASAFCRCACCLVLLVLLADIYACSFSSSLSWLLISDVPDVSNSEACSAQVFWPDFGFHCAHPLALGLCSGSPPWPSPSTSLPLSACLPWRPVPEGQRPGCTPQPLPSTGLPLSAWQGSTPRQCLQQACLGLHDCLGGPCRIPCGRSQSQVVLPSPCPCPVCMCALVLALGHHTSHHQLWPFFQCLDHHGRALGGACGAATPCSIGQRLSFHPGTHMVLLAMAMCKRMQLAVSSQDAARPG